MFDKVWQHLKQIIFCKCKSDAATLIRLKLWWGSPAKPKVTFHFKLMDLHSRAMFAWKSCISTQVLCLNWSGVSYYVNQAGIVLYMYNIFDEKSWSSSSNIQKFLTLPRLDSNPQPSDRQGDVHQLTIQACKSHISKSIIFLLHNIHVLFQLLYTSLQYKYNPKICQKLTIKVGKVLGYIFEELGPSGSIHTQLIVVNNLLIQ